MLIIRYISGAQNVIVFDDGWQSRLKEENSKHAAHSEPPAVHLDNLAYVVYSSGTTGKPKGKNLNIVNLYEARKVVSSHEVDGAAYL